jgi:NitT/TauT family transport system permease protein
MRNILYLVALLFMCACWEFAGRSSDTFRILVSRPSLVATYFVHHTDSLFTATIFTLCESLLGLLIAAIFSLLVMGLCFYLPTLLQVVLPVMVTSQIIPLITLAPLFIMAFGTGIEAKVFMSALLCFFPLFVNFAAGYQSIPTTTNELLYMYRASTWFRIVRVNVPLSLPSIMAGLKISATLSVIGAIVAEFNGADYGLGKNLFLAAKRLEPELMICSIILTALIGGAMYQTIRLAERRFGEWYL